MKYLIIKKKKYEKYEDDIHEMIKSDDKIIIKNKHTGKFFETREFNKFANLSWEIYIPNVDFKTINSCLFVLSFFLFINIVFYFLPFPFSSTNINVWCISGISLLYTIIQVFFHEVFHVFALHKTKREIDHIGFKFNYIFPSFYIRMNDVYLLSDAEKIFVHAAGLFFNCLSNGIVLFISYFFGLNILNIISKFFVIGILMNAFPVLNSDGYKIILTIFSINEYRKKSKNVAFIKAFSCVNILISILYLIKLIFDII